jgi:hypothetical protein
MWQLARADIDGHHCRRQNRSRMPGCGCQTRTTSTAYDENNDGYDEYHRIGSASQPDGRETHE